jgi:hypothetical protein
MAPLMLVPSSLSRRDGGGELHGGGGRGNPGLHHRAEAFGRELGSPGESVDRSRRQASENPTSRKEPRWSWPIRPSRVTSEAAAQAKSRHIFRAFHWTGRRRMIGA